MGRVYILNNVLIPSSAEFEYGSDGSPYVASVQFNPNNCKSTVTYYVTVDGNHYGRFTLDSNTIAWILDGLTYTSQYWGSYSTLPMIGNLSLNTVDWDANGGPAGWRWTGDSDAVVSIYYDIYFDNTELNNLWARLVNATENLCGGLSNTSIEGIHDALISYTGLIHNNIPSTPGDYVKGIAVCARYNNNECDNHGNIFYYMYGGSWDTEHVDNLIEIVAKLSFKINLWPNGRIGCSINGVAISSPRELFTELETLLKTDILNISVGTNTANYGPEGSPDENELFWSDRGIISDISKNQTSFPLIDFDFDGYQFHQIYLKINYYSVKGERIFGIYCPIDSQ